MVDGPWKELLVLLLCPDAAGLGEGEVSGVALIHLPCGAAAQHQRLARGTLLPSSDAVPALDFVSLSASWVRYVHQLCRFPYSCARFRAPGRCCGRLEGLPGGKPVWLPVALFGGSCVTSSAGRAILVDVNLRRKDRLETETQFPF